MHHLNLTKIELGPVPRVWLVGLAGLVRRSKAEAGFEVQRKPQFCVLRLDIEPEPADGGGRINDSFSGLLSIVEGLVGTV